jgi:hypothetical protein
MFLIRRIIFNLTTQLLMSESGDQLPPKNGAVSKNQTGVVGYRIIKH